MFKNWFQKVALISFQEPRKKLELRTKKSGNYQFILTLRSANERVFIYKHKLSKEEVQLIPDWLRDAMQKVNELDRPFTIYNPLIN